MSQTIFAQLSGTYTIGSTGNYTTVTSAVSALITNGVSGPVVFNIDSGTYYGQIIITDIAGTSTTNTVTFQSTTSEADDVILSFSSTCDTNNYVIFVKGADYIRFRNISIKPTGLNYAHCVHIGYVSVDILFYGCKFIGNQYPDANFSWRFSHTMSRHSQNQIHSDSLIVFDSNEFLYGSDGVALCGKTSSNKCLEEVYFINNTFNVNGGFFGFLNARNITIHNNKMNIINQNSQNFGGILSNVSGTNRITNNIFNVGNAGQFGLKISNCQSPIYEPSIIANNFLTLNPVSNYCYSLSISGCQNYRIYYNSVNVLGNLNLSTACMIGAPSLNIEVKNNIFSNYANGMAISTDNNPSSYLSSDYNNCYSNGTYLFSEQLTFITSLTAWQTATGLDSNSINVIPGFKTNTDLHISNSQLDSAGTPLYQIYNDIDGDIRNPLFPDIGADEFNMYPIDVSLNSINHMPQDSCCFSASEPLYIKIQNAGIDTIDFSQDTAYIHCFSTGSNPLVFPVVILDSGLLSVGDTMDVLISNSFNMYILGYYKFEAYLSMAADLNHLNDTIISDSIQVLQIDTFPYKEDFETYSPGFINKEWKSNLGNVNTSWQINSGSQSNPWNKPKPLYDHTLGTSLGKYAYIISVPDNILIPVFFSPCFNLDSLPVKSISFWYHIFGDGLGELHLDINTGCSWTNSIWVKSGTQQDSANTAWKKAIVDISQFSGQVRFRFRTDNAGNPVNAGPLLSYAVDDIELGNQVPNDAGVRDIVKPDSIALTGTQAVNLNIRNFGSNTLNSAQVHYSVNGILQPITTWSGSVLPMHISDTILAGNFNFSQGAATIKSWTTLPNGTADTVNTNDTLIKDIYVCNEILKGIYIIGGSNADFLTFSDAVFTLEHCGVDSAVIFLVNAGNYNEQIVIHEIPGASSLNTITFQSMNSNPNSVSLSYNSTSQNQNYVIRLDGADFIRFENISITASNIDYAHAIEFSGNATFNVFTGNIISGSQKQSNSELLAVVYCKSTPINIDSAVSFINNTINYGSYGIYAFLQNSTNLQKTGWLIKGNTFNSQVYIGCHIRRDRFTIIDSNYFSASNYWSGKSAIQLDYIRGNYQITKNQIFYSQGGTGIKLSDNNSASTKKSIVANNFIQMDGINYSIGISLFDSNVLICYNTIHSKGSHPTRSIGFYNWSADSVIFKNNIIAHTGQGYLIYHQYPIQPGFIMDYNNYYYTGSTFGKLSNSIISTFSSWKTTSGKDSNSLNVNPMFFSPSDLHTGNILLKGMATPINLITDDIDGDIRDSIAPDIGADEFTLQAVDAGIYELVTPSLSTSIGNNPVTVKIKNYGLTTLTSSTINWEFNNIVQTPFNWTGNLSSGILSSSISLGNININLGYNMLKIWTSNPNNTIDPIPINDTIKVNIFGCNGPMSGSYTIGGGSASFQTIGEAVSALQKCGIGGAVIFNINSGIYDEQIFINNIAGLSATNNIVFQSANGDSTSVVIQFDPPTTYFDYVLRMENVKFIKFSKLTIKAYGTNYGRVFDIADSTENITIENCVIEGLQTNQSNNYWACCYSSNENIKSLFIHNNLIKYGTYGFSTIFGMSNQKSDSIIISNNYFQDCKQGIYASNCNAIRITSNVIDNQTVNTSSGIRLQSCDSSIYISKNKILSKKYGIKLSNCDGVLNAKGEISNNMISLDNYSYLEEGISLELSDYQRLYYNSVGIFDNAASKCVSISSCIGFEIFNNNFAHFAGGLALNSSSLPDTADYNNYFTTGIMLAQVGNNGYSNLSQLQQGTGKDIHSISVDPDFISQTNLHLNSSALDGKASPIANISDDIDGDIRNPVAPDIGADEFAPFLSDIGSIAIVQPTVNYSSTGVLITVEATIKNFGSDTVFSFNLGYIAGNLSPLTAICTDTIYPGATIDYQFTSTFAAPSGQINLCVFTNLTNDGNLLNDTICKTFTGLPIVTVAWSDNFDTVPNYWVNPDGIMQWEHGIPSASKINNAYSNPNVWATNLDGQYSGNNYDNLYGPFFDFSQAQGASLTFRHWIETQSGDGGNVQVSTDGGNSWSVLGNTSNPNWYTNNIAGIDCWNGTSSGWQLSTYNLDTFDYHPTPIQFRFHFFSSPSGNDDGWAIDDFAIVLPKIPKDAGIVDIITPTNSTAIGSNVSVQVTIKNFGTDTLNSIPVNFKITGQTATSEVWTGLLLPDSTVNYTFSTTYIAPNTNYDLCTWTSLINDIYSNNDSICKNISTAPAANDVGFISIIQPDSFTLINSNIVVTAKIQNFGTNTITSIPLEYECGINLAQETWTGNLLPDSTESYTFATTYFSPTGNYSLCVRTKLPSDINLTNDEICESLNGTISIDEYDDSKFILLQNIPNPTKGITTIGYIVPKAGKIKFEVINLLGKTIYSEDKNVLSGKHQIDLNVKNLANGIYYYSVVFDGKKLVKKMLVN